jgi:hypothetical protein
MRVRDNIKAISKSTAEGGWHHPEGTRHKDPPDRTGSLRDPWIDEILEPQVEILGYSRRPLENSGAHVDQHEAYTAAMQLPEELDFNLGERSEFHGQAPGQAGLQGYAGGSRGCDRQGSRRAEDAAS